jgi:flagellar hook-associated protein 3 FlgL
MSANYISTYVLSSTLRHSVMSGQTALSKASTEATTGRFADVGLDLGHSTGRDVAMRADLSFMDQIVDTNGLVVGRLDVTQNRLEQLVKTAQDFLKNIIAARDTDNGAGVVVPGASANLQDLIATLNLTYDGEYLFGGINTQNTPIASYAAGSTSKNAIDAAFAAAFGVSQNSPAVINITAAQMQNFLNTGFVAEFASPAWGNNWSSASNQVLSSRISTTEIANTSASANDPGFIKLAQAYTMMSDLGTAGMNKNAFQVVVDKAVSLVSEAVNDLALLQASIGSAQQRVTTATNKLKIQSDLLTQQVTGMEKVDPAEASVRISALQTQIETSLSLTARLQKISLINYL